MMLKNSSDSYGLVSKSLHWLFLILLVTTIIIIGSAEDLPDGPEKFSRYAAHQSIGVLLLLLVAFRSLWRMKNERPIPLGKNELQKKLGHFMHLALYALLFAQPIFGILMSQAAGHAVPFFGLFELPMLVGENESFADIMHEAHEVTAILLVLAVIVHALAALKHHFIDKDRTLIRMLKD